MSSDVAQSFKGDGCCTVARMCVTSVGREKKDEVGANQSKYGDKKLKAVGLQEIRKKIMNVTVTD